MRLEEEFRTVETHVVWECEGEVEFCEGTEECPGS